MAGLWDSGLWDIGLWDGSAAVAEIPRVNMDRIGGSGGKKKKKPKKDEIVAEVVEAVEDAVTELPAIETRMIALRLAEQMTVAQLRQAQTIATLIARVEAEIAEMDDEEVLLLAA